MKPAAGVAGLTLMRGEHCRGAGADVAGEGAGRQRVQARAPPPKRAHHVSDLLAQLLRLVEGSERMLAQIQVSHVGSGEDGGGGIDEGLYGGWWHAA